MFVTDKYILDGHTPVQVLDLYEWGEWFQSAERHVAHDFVGRVEVSTVFLGMDHGWIPNQPPVLFETLVIGGGIFDEAMMRYATWDEAAEGHQFMLRCVQAYALRLERYDALRLHDRYLRFPKPKRAPFWCPSTTFKESRRKWKRINT